LAKAFEGETAEPELQNSPTLSAAATRTGVLLGTPAYMSLESRHGASASIAAPTYGPLAACSNKCSLATPPSQAKPRRTFLASVIRAEPDWSSLPGSVPPRIHELLRRCLQKDAKQRLRDIGDARIIIEEALSGSACAPAVPLWQALGKSPPGRQQLFPVAPVPALGALFPKPFVS
jgi:serine/threonine protein kinase